jgi:acyl carrier protein
MNLQEIETTVAEIIVKKLGISEADISPESTLKDLGANDLQEVEIMLEVEQLFYLTIPDYLEPEIFKFSNLCNYIERKCS